MFVSAFWLLVAPPLSCALLMLSPAKAGCSSYPLLQNMAGTVGGKGRGKEAKGWGGLEGCDRGGSLDFPR